MAGKSDLDAMQAFVSDLGVDSFQHIIDDDSGSLWETFGVRSQPAFAFINDDGTITLHSGALGPDGLETRLTELEAQ